MNEKVLQAVIKLRDEISKPLASIRASMQAAEAQTNANKKTTEQLAKTMQDTGKKATLMGGAIVASVGGALVASTKKAIEFESAFAGVKKTLNTDGMTDAQVTKTLDSMNKGLRDMSKTMPTSAVELAGIAEAAGQLGIATPNILSFTKTMAMMGDATNMTAEDVATSFAQIANVTRMPQDEFDKLGSTVVALGNKGASTEADIVGLMNRIAASGKQVNMSVPQIASWSSAMASLGITAEAGGTSFNKTLSLMQIAVETNSNKLTQFAKVAGMSASEFKQAFKKDASGALFEFTKGLGNTERNGKSTIGVLKDLGINSSEQILMLSKLAGGTQTVADSITTGNNAWKENIALQNEVAQRYGTTESQLAIMRNKISDLQIEIGNAFLPVVRDAAEYVGRFASAFAGLDPNVKQTIITVSLIILAIGGFLLIAGIVISLVGTAITLFSGLGTVLGIVAGVFTFLCTPVGLLIGVMVAVTGGVLLMREAWNRNLGGIQEKTKKVIDTVTGWWDNFIKFITHPISTTVSVFKKVSESKPNPKKGTQGKAKDSRNAFGSGRITRDGQIAELHQGEKVLTKKEANQYDKGNMQNVPNIIINGMTVREEADITKFAKSFVRELNNQKIIAAGGM